MGWRVHGFFVGLRTLSFFSSHISWIVLLISGCAYFQMWKSYDILWLWTYTIVTCVVPKLRYENLILQCTFLWNKTCVQGERWRFALKEQDKRIDEEDDKSAKLVNALGFGVVLLRLRVSAAILIGNVHLFWNVGRDGKDIKPQEYIVDWAAFQYSVWLDMVLFWMTILFALCLQCRLCCQLGCLKYNLWCVAVVAAGAVLMEIPMYFAFVNLDKTWCNFTVDEPVTTKYMTSNSSSVGTPTLAGHSTGTVVKGN